MKKALLLLPMLALLAGCGGTKTTTTVTEDGTRVTTKTDSSGMVEITSDDGYTATAQTNKLPSDWPSDIPLGGDITVVSTLSGPEGVFATVEEQGVAADVTARYRASLQTEGWVETGYSSFGEFASVTWEKDGRTLSMGFVQSQESNATGITISFDK